LRGVTFKKGKRKAEGQARTAAVAAIMKSCKK
jgi:hypothetical protein